MEKTKNIIIVGIFNTYYRLSIAIYYNNVIIVTKLTATLTLLQLLLAAIVVNINC